MKHQTRMGILTAIALGVLSSTVCECFAEEKALGSSTVSGLSFTAVPTAFYVRLGDQLRQVALLSCRPDGVGGVLPRERSLSVSGDRTFIDAAHGFDRPTVVTHWEVYCVHEGHIQLRIYRLRGSSYVMVASAKPRDVETGWHRFALKKPIAVRRGDLVGFWLSKDAAIAADPGGEVSSLPGQQNNQRIRIRDSEVDPRTCSICAYGMDKSADTKSWEQLHRSGTLEVSSDLERRSIPLASLRRDGDDFILDVPEVSVPTQVSLKLKGGPGEMVTSVDVVPQPKWNVFMLFSVHTDIGYTTTQEECTKILVNNILRAAQWCKRRRDLPELDRHRWHVEGSYLLDSMSRLDPRKEKAVQEIAPLFREGLMELDGEYANVHTGACSAESLIRYLYYSAGMEQKWGIPFHAASMTDVPSGTWALPSVLAGAGIRYFSVGQNFRSGGNRIPDYPLFYWEGPDGKKVLTASMRGYALLTLDHLIDRPRELGNRLMKVVASGYPYDSILFHGLYTDNTPMTDELHQRTLHSIDEWNQTWAYPRLSCTTVERYGRYMEEKYGGQIPTIRGDWGDTWEDGLASAASETATIRQVHESLPACEALAAWASSRQSLPVYPAERFQEAWRNVWLFDEHTWGAAKASREPESEMTRKQWGVKAAHANDAASQTCSLWQQMTGALLQDIPRPEGDWAVVFNSLSWTRTEPVRLDLPDKFGEEDQVRVIDGVSHHEIPSQRDNGKLVFLANEVPSMGYKLFRLEAKPGSTPSLKESRSEEVVESPFYRATADRRSGGLTSLIDKQIDRELVDSKSDYALNEYVCVFRGFNAVWRRFNRKPSPPQRPQEASVIRTTQGPVFNSLVCRTKVEGAPQIDQEVKLYRDIKRVDFVNHLDLKQNYDTHIVYYAFPFAPTPLHCTLGLPGSVVEVEGDLMKCANRNWFSVEHWVDVRSDNWGVTWAPVEAPVVSLGDIPDHWIPHLPEERGRVFSMIMNNVWGTNFPPGQAGMLKFHYALTSNGGTLNRAAAHRFGAEVSRPLECSFLSGAHDGNLPGGQASFCIVRPKSVVVQALKVAEDGRGLIVRLRETDGFDADALVTFPLLDQVRAISTDLVERDREPLQTRGNVVNVGLLGNGLSTVRILAE